MAGPELVSARASSGAWDRRVEPGWQGEHRIGAAARDHDLERRRGRGPDRFRARRAAPGCVRQRAPRRGLDVSLGRTNRPRRGNRAADQDDGRTVFGRRGRDSGAFGVRTPGGHRGPSGARAARLSRLDRGLGETGRRMSMSTFRSISRVAAGLVVAALWLVPAAAQEPLRPELAYPYEVTADGETLRVRFDIVDGYYLYRSKFSFEAATPGVELRPAVFPRGEIHSDEFFGEQEIYRGAFEIALPYRRSTPADRLELRI